jgi:hypothetical protein
MRLTGPQIAAGMALASITQDQLAIAAEIGRNSVNRAINDAANTKDETMNAIRSVLESRGIEFIGSIGVQWAQHQVRSLVGVEGLKTFFNDVRATVKESDEEVVICGVAEDYLEEKLGEYLDFHRKEMAEYGNVEMRCLIKEGDPNFGASEYCSYRWQPKENFSNVPFYVYGDKLAIIVTSGPEDPLIILHHNKTIAQAYRRQFDIVWSASKEPSKTKAKT